MLPKTNRDNLTAVYALLDGDLPAAEQEAVRVRAAGDPELARVLRAESLLRSEREAYFLSLEPGEQELAALTQRVLAPTRSHGHYRIRRWVQIGLASAACLAIGYFGGQWQSPAAKPVENAVPGLYQVTLTDSSGRALAAQQFKSLEEARLFADDIARVREQQERAISGQFVVTADSF